MKMMMLKEFTAILVGLSLFSTVIEANIGESLQMRLYNRDFHAPASKILEMLKKADLEGHGYQKEVTIKRVKKPDKPEYLEKSNYYYKIVNCSRVPEIEQELDNLLSGAFGSELAAKLTKEMKGRHLEDMGKCKTGVEIVFNYGSNKANLQRKKRAWRVKIRIGPVVITIEKNILKKNGTKAKAKAKATTKAHKFGGKKDYVVGF